MNDENPYGVSPASHVPPPALPPPLPSMADAGEKTPWNGWWTLLWSCATMVVMGVGQLLIFALMWVIYRQFTTSSEVPSIELLAEDGDLTGIIAFVSIAIVCPFCWFLGWLKKGWGGFEYLALQKVKIFPLVGWSVAMFFFVVLLGLISPFLGIDETPDSMLQLAATSEYPIFLILGVVVGAPLTEEFIFRGLLFRGWQSSKLQLTGTLIVTSAIWAVIHVQYEPALIAVIFVMGIFLGLARYFTGNLWVPIAMHAVNNGLATIGLFAAAGN